jgi:SH3-like domain-containing protein
MDLFAVGKSLSKRNAFSSKRVAFFVVAGLLFVVGLVLRSGYFDQPDVEPTAPVTVTAPPPSAPVTPAAEPTESVAETPPQAQEPATAPNEQAEQTGEAVQQADEAVERADEPAKQAKQADEATQRAKRSESPGSDMILVSRRPVEVRAGPSASAPVMYGFPAGRPFRVIGRDGGFAQIKDLKSGASGWIDEAALAPPPPRAPAVSAPSRRKPVRRKSAKPPADSKPKATETDSQVTADSEAATEPVQTRRQPGLFGGLFGGIFNN